MLQWQTEVATLSNFLGRKKFALGLFLRAINQCSANATQSVGCRDIYRYLPPESTPKFNPQPTWSLHLTTLVFFLLVSLATFQEVAVERQVPHEESLPFPTLILDVLQACKIRMGQVFAPLVWLWTGRNRGAQGYGHPQPACCLTSLTQEVELNQPRVWASPEYKQAVIPSLSSYLVHTSKVLNLYSKQGLEGLGTGIPLHITLSFAFQPIPTAWEKCTIGVEKSREWYRQCMGTDWYGPIFQPCLQS